MSARNSFWRRFRGLRPPCIPGMRGNRRTYARPAHFSHGRRGRTFCRPAAQARRERLFRRLVRLRPRVRRGGERCRGALGGLFSAPLPARPAGRAGSSFCCRRAFRRFRVSASCAPACRWGRKKEPAGAGARLFLAVRPGELRRVVPGARFPELAAFLRGEGNRSARDAFRLCRRGGGAGRRRFGKCAGGRLKNRYPRTAICADRNVAQSGKELAFQKVCNPTKTGVLLEKSPFVLQFKESYRSKEGFLMQEIKIELTKTTRKSLPTKASSASAKFSPTTCSS